MRSLFALLGALAGCSGGDDAPAPTGGESHTYGVFYGIRQEALGSPPAEASIDVALGARVARYEGIDRTTVSEVLELSGFETDDLPPDECGDPVTAATLADLGGLETNAVVELVDLGPLEVRSADAVRLDAKSFPDLFSVVSGVVYDGDGAASVALAPGSEVTYAAEGGGGVGSIEATSTVPPVVEALRIAGADPWLGPPALVRGDELGVTWSAAAGGDEIRIELVWMQPAGPVVVSCRAVDDGEFVVPAASTRLVPELAASGDPRMIVRRIRRSDVAATGLDEGALVLEEAVSFPLRIQ
jgi:hypothetical protein